MIGLACDKEILKVSQYSVPAGVRVSKCCSHTHSHATGGILFSRQCPFKQRRREIFAYFDSCVANFGTASGQV